MHLIEECRELWVDPASWRQHLIDSICRLTGLAVGEYIEIDPTTLDGGPMRAFVATDRGWRDADARSYYARYIGQRTAGSAPAFPGMKPLFSCLSATGRAIALREEMCADSEWYRSEVLNEYRRPAFNDGSVLSFICDPANGICSHLGVHQDPIDAPPTLHTRRLVQLVHRWISPLIGNVLARECHRSRHGLTPRQNQTLDRLLAGDSQKQIALRLKISPPTAHEHVTKLYRHFDVNSHAELMAYFVLRRPARISR